MPRPSTTLRSKHHREAGAAMMVVMLMLLVGTTIASMTVHSISLEMRSAGYYRQQAQTHYVAESALQGMMSLAPALVSRRLQDARALPAPPAEVPDITNMDLITNYGEPDPALIPGLTRPPTVVRMAWDEVNAMLVNVPLGGQPVQEGILGSLGVQAFVPWYVLDFMDVEVDPAPVPGQNAGGNGNNFFNVRSTVTVRGRTLLDNGVAADPVNGVADGTVAPQASRGVSGSVVGDAFQKYTDAAYDMRIAVQFGPVP